MADCVNMNTFLCIYQKNRTIIFFSVKPPNILDFLNTSFDSFSMINAYILPSLGLNKNRIVLCE